MGKVGGAALRSFGCRPHPAGGLARPHILPPSRSTGEDGGERWVRDGAKKELQVRRRHACARGAQPTGSAARRLACTVCHPI
jgi:hypothetical protein